MGSTIRFIHRTLGLIGSLIILMMAITGLLLNHREIIGYSTASAYKLQEFLFALHSGEIGNTNFVWITDFGAICMIVLSITGISMWFELLLVKLKGRKKRERQT